MRETKAAQERTRLPPTDLDVIELNEAFAAQALAAGRKAAPST